MISQLHRLGLVLCVLNLVSSASYAADKKSISKRAPANNASVSAEELLGSSCKGLASNYDLGFSIVEKGVKGELTATLGASQQNEFEITYNLDGTKAKMTVLDSMNSNSLVAVVPQGEKSALYFYCTK